MCRVLQAPYSGYFRWQKALNEESAQENQRYKDLIRILHAESFGSYGVRRITRELKNQGFQVNHKRIRRLMRELGLQGKGTPKKKRFTATTDSEHSEPIAPNHLKREFIVSAPNQWWVGDITYIWTDEGWAFLAVVIDLFSRKVVGWAMDTTINSELVMKALERAVIARSPGPGLTFHSDRGVQYASAAFRALLKKFNIRQSMSRKGNCWDNSVAESFFGSLKKERIKGLALKSFQQAYDVVFNYIEHFYNSWRQHSFCLQRSPSQWKIDASLNAELINSLPVSDPVYGSENDVRVLP